MKFKLISTVAVYLVCFSYETALAQVSAGYRPLNTIYIEALGMGGYGSINYERLLYQRKKLHIGMRMGLGTYRLRDFETNLNPDITVPFSVNAYYGRTHHIEAGLGQTFTSIVGASPVDFAVERNNGLSSNFNIGYRYQKTSRGLMFRLNYSPILSTGQSVKHWYGMSVGYSF